MSQLHLPHSSLRFRFPSLPSLYLRRAAWSPKQPTKSPLLSTLELNSTQATVFPPVIVVKSHSSESDVTSQFELGKTQEAQKPQKQANGIFLIILINIAIYVADHLYQVHSIKSLYLYHNFPAWYQFVTATFCHANWNHLSANLILMYIFGKTVEEEKGSLGLWLSYLFTGAGAHLVYWLVIPRNVVSVGSSGAVFGLFVISFLVKTSRELRKFLKFLIYGQFVVTRVIDAPKASAGLAEFIFGGFGFETFLMTVTKSIAHFSGALVGVVLVWLLSKYITSKSVDQEFKKSPQ